MSMSFHNAIAGPSSRTPNAQGDDVKKDSKKRKESSGKLGKDIHERRDDGRTHHENIAQLQRMSALLATRPDAVPMYDVRLFPLSLERSSLLVQLELEEKNAMENAHRAYDEERQRVEEEWQRGHDKVRQRLLDGIEERRRRARDEKEGEGTAGDASMEQTRPHITRKLRNKIGTSPPPTPLGAAPGSALANSAGVPAEPLVNASGISALPITSGPFLNPHSLSVDEIPSPFPLPLTSTSAPASAAVPTTGPNGRKKPKGGGNHANASVGGLGKSLLALTGSKDAEVEADLMEIRRANKRRRALLGK